MIDKRYPLMFVNKNKQKSTSLRPNGGAATSKVDALSGSWLLTNLIVKKFTFPFYSLHTGTEQYNNEAKETSLTDHGDFGESETVACSASSFTCPHVICKYFLAEAGKPFSQVRKLRVMHLLYLWKFKKLILFGLAERGEGDKMPPPSEGFC